MSDTSYRYWATDEEIPVRVQSIDRYTASPYGLRPAAHVILAYEDGTTAPAIVDYADLIVEPVAA